MRKGVVISLLCCLVCTSISAQGKQDLIGRWLPQYENPLGDENCSEMNNFWILNILSIDSLIFESPGANVGFKHFDLETRQDSLFMFGESDSLKVAIETLSAERLVLSGIENYKVTFVKMPGLGLAAAKDKVNKVLTNNLLEFQSQTDSKFLFQAEFAPILIDSGLILTPFLPVVKNAKMRKHTQVTEREVYWSVASHGTDLIFKLINIDSGLDMTLLAKEVTNDYLLFEYWSCKGKELIEARLIHKSNEAKFRKKLSRPLWQLKDNQPHDSYIHLSTTRGGYFEPPEDYLRDSSLLINDKDILENRLRISFDNDGHYQILREERVLDFGNWIMLFDNMTLKLISERENSEGIFGGYIFIEKITKRKLKIVRRWTMEKNYLQNIENSDLETYKAVKN